MEEDLNSAFADSMTSFGTTEQYFIVNILKKGL